MNKPFTGFVPSNRHDATEQIDSSLKSSTATQHSGHSLLKALWRSGDHHQISIMDRSKNTFRNLPVASIDEAIDQARLYSNNGSDVYFACAEFRSSEQRKACNASGAFAFWLDIDCGDEKATDQKGYKTQDAARTALQEFCAKNSLPAPTHIVLSGSGLHVYWVVTECIGAPLWQNTARKLKELTGASGFLVDPSRTADIASVLRIPGTYNYKTGSRQTVTLEYSTDQYIDKTAAIEAINLAHERFCCPDLHKVSVGQETTANLSEPLDLDNLRSALITLDPDCDERTWKLHRISILARYATAQPERHDELYSIAKSWSSGELRGKPSVAWNTPGRSNGRTGSEIFDSVWERFLKEDIPENRSTVATIYFHAKEAGWNLRESSVPVHNSHSTELADAFSTIKSLLPEIVEDPNVVLEDQAVFALAAIQQSKPADYQRQRAALKQANPKVSLTALDMAVKARAEELNAAQTHHGYAENLLIDLKIGTHKPVAYQGSLFRLDPATHLWKGLNTDHLIRRVAASHDGKPNCERRSDYRAIAEHAISLASNEDFFQQAPVGIACPNGFYRIVGTIVEVEPLSPEHRQRVMLKHAPVREPTPAFDAFLHETFGSPDSREESEQINLVQEIFGATMLGLMPKYQKAALYYDPFGRAGKGTLMEIQTELVPHEYVTAVSPFNWGKEYHVASLAGVRLNVVGELPDSESIPAAMFKTVIGGDLITGRHPTHRPITFKNEAAHIFMSNHLINTRDHTEAFFTRWLVVEFPNSRLRSGLPLEVGLAQRIIANEMPGIIHWALQGALRLIEQGKFSSSKAHDRLMAKWRRSSNSLEEFIAEECELYKHSEYRRSEFYKHYTEWCSENGRKSFAKGRVKELLEHNIGLGIRLVEVNGYETFRGVSKKFVAKQCTNERLAAGSKLRHEDITAVPIGTDEQ